MHPPPPPPDCSSAKSLDLKTLTQAPQPTDNLSAAELMVLFRQLCNSCLWPKQQLDLEEEKGQHHHHEWPVTPEAEEERDD